MVLVLRLALLRSFGYMTILRFGHPSELGGMPGTSSLTVKIGLLGASFDFASVNLVVCSDSQLWRNSSALHCASNSELHFRQSQKERSEGSWSSAFA